MHSYKKSFVITVISNLGSITKQIYKDSVKVYF